MLPIDLSRCPKGLIEVVNAGNRVELERIQQVAEIGLKNEAVDGILRRWFLDIRKPLAEGSQCEFSAAIGALREQCGLTADRLQKQWGTDRGDTGNILEFQFSAAMYAAARLVMEDMIKLARYAEELEEENGQLRRNNLIALN